MKAVSSSETSTRLHDVTSQKTDIFINRRHENLKSISQNGNSFYEIIAR
jgi:hypothetical protein